MKLKKFAFAATVGSAAALAIIGAGVASAAPPIGPTSPVSSSATAPSQTNPRDLVTDKPDAVKDIDILQQGDQTAPDTGTVTDADGGKDVNNGKDATDGTGTAAETGASDGNDGGHADPIGTAVDHVGGANEQ